MATQKTLTPTNQTITIDAFQGEKPDHRHVADAEGKLADAINALNSQFAIKTSGSLYDLAGKSGVYWLTSAVTDKPESGAGMFIIQSYNATYCAGLFVATDNKNAYIVTLSGTTWTTKQLAPDLINGEKTISSIAAGAIATGYVDVQFPSGRTRAMSAFPAYTTSGLPITSVYLDSGAATGYQRVQFAVRNVTSAAVTNEKVTIKVMFV